jgi:hypothetical protein
VRRLCSLILVVSLTLPLAAQGPFGQPSGFAVENPILRRIWAIGMDSSQLPRLAQVLFDSLGPRLTASPGMEAAQNWIVATYAAWGISARKEQYGTWRGWRRGRSHLDLVAPRVRSLEATTLAWSPGTPRGRPVRAPVVILPDVADSAAFVAWLPQAKGKFVLISFPQPTCRPDDSWEKWATQTTVDTLKARRSAALQAWQQRVQHGRYTWHTNRDTYDKISFDDVKNNATLAAMLVYLASEDTTRMPRGKRDAFSPRPNGQPGAWPDCQQPQRATAPPVPPVPPQPPARP